IIPDIASRNDVAFLHGNPIIQFDIQKSQSAPFYPTFYSQNILTNTEWGIDKISAPLVWAKGITGTGAIVAGQDTGYYWNHPALIGQYRGWDGTEDDHNYSWHDAISVDLNGDGNNSCGYSLDEPCDDVGSSHGTHTMGTMIGLSGSNQIGVAPGASWIACRNMEEGFGTPETYIDCFQWFLAPTDLNDQNPDPTKSPHVINNSWGCPTSEGCNTSNFEIMNTVVNNLRAAGIVVVTSAGNSGSSCSSVRTPAAIYEGAFSVGATTSGDGIASFSSRGPVTADGSNRIKPNVSAPGVSVRSASGVNNYASLSGTSMAAPHVTGAAALLISAYPPIAGNVEAIESYLEETADFLGVGSCGGDANFNNTFGHGRINAAEAVDLLLDLNISKQSGVVETASQTLSYTISVEKSGPFLTFTDTIVTDTIPEGTVIQTSSHPVSINNNQLEWDIGQLAPNDPKELEITLYFSETQTLTPTLTLDSATVSASNVPEQVSNRPEVSVPVFGLLRDIPLSAKDNRINFDGNTVEIDYTINLTAPTSTNGATNIIITETLPISATLITSSESITPTNNGFIWSLNSLTAGEAIQLQIKISIPVSETGILPTITFPSTQVSSSNSIVTQSSAIRVTPNNIWMPLVVK
ncbi:MAG: S8 family serine peptidase, partial [Chloroflexota bacterium]